MTEPTQPESKEIAFGVYRADGAQSETVPTVAPTSEPASQDAADDETSASPQ